MIRPNPLPRPKRLTEEKPVTVCIAVACNQGREVISATDGMTSYGDITADVGLPKMYWFGDWTFLYSGQPANADLIFEEIRIAATKDPSALSRENIQSTVRRAYKTRFARWSADRNLSPYDMEMAEFKKTGLRIFGEQRMAELSRQIEKDSQYFEEELLVVGWGKSPHSVTIFGVNRDGVGSHSLSGMATIGSGGTVAMTTLLLLGCGRGTPFEYALYAVAAAKFAAERCIGVGRDTTMFVSRKRNETDEAGKAPGNFIPDDHIVRLRELWEKYSKPQIPEDALLTLHRISRDAGFGGGFEIFERFMRMMSSKLSTSEKSEPGP